MSDTQRALEAAQYAIYSGLLDRKAPSHMTRECILAFLRAMPDSSDDEPDPFWHVSSLIAAIEKETAP